MAIGLECVRTLPGVPASPGGVWEPQLRLYEQTLVNTDRSRPVLYIHGATFPASNSLLFNFDDGSWAYALNKAGFSAWALDFAGFGGSERYPEMSKATPPTGEPLGRTPEAARQIERAVRAIIAETGVRHVSIIAHSWGTMAAGYFAGEHPELVDRIVLFGPIVKRGILKSVPPLGPWRLLTAEEQLMRIVEDVPNGHPAVLAEANFPAWTTAYLNSDPTSSSRTPCSVKTPNGPIADIMAAWSGSLAYDPAKIKSPVAIIRGEWDSLCTDADVAWLLASLSSAPEKTEIKIPMATHLMHLEIGRAALHQASNNFLTAKRGCSV